MTLREIISNETISILTEEKVASLVEYIILRYDGTRKRFNDHRLEGAYKSKNEKDKRLFGDDNQPLSKDYFRKACVALFDKRAAREKIKMPRNEFVIELNNHLSFFDDEGYLLPRRAK